MPFVPGSGVGNLSVPGGSQRGLIFGNWSIPQASGGSGGAVQAPQDDNATYVVLSDTIREMCGQN